MLLVYSCKLLNWMLTKQWGSPHRVTPLGIWEKCHCKQKTAYLVPVSEQLLCQCNRCHRKRGSLYWWQYISVVSVQSCVVVPSWVMHLISELLTRRKGSTETATPFVLSSVYRSVLKGKCHCSNKAWSSTPFWRPHSSESVAQKVRRDVLSIMYATFLTLSFRDNEQYVRRLHVSACRQRISVCWQTIVPPLTELSAWQFWSC